jgi:hypothetical protein
MGWTPKSILIFGVPLSDKQARRYKSKSAPKNLYNDKVPSTDYTIHCVTNGDFHQVYLCLVKFEIVIGFANMLLIPSPTQDAICQFEKWLKNSCQWILPEKVQYMRIHLQDKIPQEILSTIMCYMTSIKIPKFGLYLTGG